MYTTALAKVGRFYPFFSGNFRLVNYSMLARFFASKNSLARCPSPGGQILVPLNDEVGRCIYFTGDYEPENNMGLPQAAETGRYRH
jgi:hypothetical protein